MTIQKMLHGADYNPDQWLDNPDILKNDVLLMKKAGINCVSLAIFAWSTIEAQEGVYKLEWLQERIQTLYENGIYTVLATPSGARPVWMAKKYPEVLRVAADRKRNLMGGRHNHCYTSPVYREKVWAINKRIAESFANHPGVILWHLSNEYNGECYCDLCMDKFRIWLKNKYKTLDVLNKAWWTSFWSHTYTNWEQIEAPAPNGENEVHGLVLDWKRFVTHQTVDFCAWEKESVKEGGSTLPVTTNFMAFYQGLDYSAFKDVMDIISWDNYPAWHCNIPKDVNNNDVELAAIIGCAHDMMRCMHKDKAPFLLMESTPSVVNWRPVAKLLRPGMLMLSGMQAIAHGSNSVQYFQWRKSRGSCEQFHGAIVDHSGNDNDRVFRDVAKVGDRLKRLDELCESRVRPQVAFINDQENRWAIAEALGPRNSGMHYQETLYNHYTPFWKSGIMTDVINMDCNLDGYKIVVAPMLYLHKNGYAEKLRVYVEQGGILIGTYHSGIVDENNLCFLGAVPYNLTDVFGLRREEIDGLQDGETNSMNWKGKTYTLFELCERVIPSTAEVLSVYNEDFYAGEATVTKNSFGEGIAYYIAARIEVDFLIDFYDEIISRAKVKPSVDAVLPYGVTAGQRHGNDKDFIFIQNYNNTKANVTLHENLTDFESGETVSDILTLEGYEVRILWRHASNI